MVFRARKFFVWLTGLLIVSAVYLLVTQLSESPKIEYERSAESLEDSNVGGRIGKIGARTGVGTVKKAKFLEFDEAKQVIGEFGFEKLLHKRGDEWEIEKPYRNIFRSDFTCNITADMGNIVLESDVDRPTPKDAAFTGNVVIHIVPADQSEVQESVIYLDDITFINERSLFTTSGPVEFVSDQAHLLGRGLEFVYNEIENRIEYLGIIELKCLRIKSTKAAMFSTKGADDDKGTLSSEAKIEDEKNSRDKKSSSQIVVTKDNKISKAGHSKVKQSESAEQKEINNYKCVLGKNVLIDTPDEVVFALDEIVINNIFMDKTSKGLSEEKKAGVDGLSQEKIAAGDQQQAETKGTVPAKPVVKTESEPNKLPEEDIVITCDGGIVVRPMDSTRVHIQSIKLGQDKQKSKETDIPKLSDAGKRPVFAAKRIDYDASSDETVALGASELTFYSQDMVENDTNRPAVPVVVTCKDKVEFLPSSKQVFFKGDCVSEMIREDANSQQKYILSAPKFTIDLTMAESNEADIEHFTADGGLVRLINVKTRQGKFVGGVELKCQRFDFDPNQQLATSTGPGQIKVDNSHIISEPGEKVDKFSFQKPCWALVENFDTLRYFIKDNKIIADAQSHRINLGYVSILDEKAVNATAGYIEAKLIETTDGRSEISSLSAKQGVSYEEKSYAQQQNRKKRDIEFLGSEFFYDANTGMITAWGDQSRPCLLNGARAKGVEYNLNTGKAKSKLIGPGVLY